MGIQPYRSQAQMNEFSQTSNRSHKASCRYKLRYCRFLFLAGILYGIAIAGTSLQWDLWLPPLLPIGCAVFLTFSYAQDADHMRKHTRFGYRVRLGEPAPEFELPDQDGKPVKLSDYRGKHPLLLIFVRGDWCPGCHMMLRTYERNRERSLEKGIHVLGIGPDNIAVNNDMAKRIGIGYASRVG